MTVIWQVLYCIYIHKYDGDIDNVVFLESRNASVVDVETCDKWFQFL